MEMTKEQIEACEKLGQHHLGSWYKDNDYPVFEEGFQAAQSPEILMLNPLVKGLVEALFWYGENAASINQMKFDPFDCGAKAAKALAPFKEGE